MGKLFSTKGKDKVTTETNVKNLPSWLQNEVYTIRDTATDLFNKPYEAYTGNQLAGFNPDQLQTMQGVRDLQGKYDPMLQQSADTLSGIASSNSRPPTPEEIQAYMNPYITNVADITKSRSIEDYTKQVGDIRNQAAKAGAFGGDRRFILEGQANQDISRNLAEIDTNALKDGYDRAMTMRTTNNNQSLQASQSLADLAKLRQGQDLTGLAALEQQGMKQQAQDQAGLDIDLEKWQQEKAYPYEQLSYYNNLISPYATAFAGNTNTKVEPTKKKSTFDKIVGTAVSLGSLAMGNPIPMMSQASGGFGGAYGAQQRGIQNPSLYGPGFKTGGLVEDIKKYASGGQVKSKAQRVLEAGNDFNPVQDYLLDPVKDYITNKWAGAKEQGNSRKESLSNAWNDLFGNKDSGNKTYVPELAPLQNKNVGEVPQPQGIESTIPDVTDQGTNQQSSTDALMSAIEGGKLSGSPTEVTTDPETAKVFGLNVNVPLLKAGIAILTSKDTDTFANLGYGLEAFIDSKTGIADKVKQDALDKEDQDIKRLTKEAYAMQVKAYADKLKNDDGAVSVKPIDFGKLVQIEKKRLAESQNSIMYTGPKKTDTEIQQEAIKNVQDSLSAAGGMPNTVLTPPDSLQALSEQQFNQENYPVGDIPIPAGPRGQFSDVAAGQQPLAGVNLQQQVNDLQAALELGAINKAEFDDEMRKLGITQKGQ